MSLLDGPKCTMVERWLHTRHTNGMSCWRYFVLCMSVNLQHNMLLLVYQHVLLEVNHYQHVVGGIPTTTCCCWFTNMLLEVNQQQHVVVGLPTCVVGGPTPPTPTHQRISWVFPFLMRAWFPPKHNIIILLITWCMQFDSIYNGWWR